MSLVSKSRNPYGAPKAIHDEKEEFEELGNSDNEEEKEEDE